MGTSSAGPRLAALSWAESVKCRGHHRISTIGFPQQREGRTPLGKAWPDLHCLRSYE